MPCNFGRNDSGNCFSQNQLSNMKYFFVLGYMLSRHGDMRENLFEKIASEWFRLSKLRFEREKKKQEQPVAD